MNAPTLIVGLGGKGSDIALRVSQLVSEEQRKHIEFVAMDTDVNELREIRKKNPFVRTIQTSTKLTVGEYLDFDTHSRDTWFPVNAILNNKSLTEGAGQVRAISRLAFETAVRAGKMEELDSAIENLYKLEGNEYEQALRVIVVSSLAGGTGSGLILPVGLYIKHFLATRFRQGANITRGFFLLPEVFYGVIPGASERNNLKSNAYATLREIDAFMMKGDSTLPEKYKTSVCMEFPSIGSEGYEEYDVRPYDYCFLYDAQNADGKKLNSFEQYLQHAANCIYAQSIGPTNKRSNSSEDNTIRALCAEKGRNRYAGAGTSILKYPTEDIREYIAFNWAKECVSDQWLKYDKEYKEQQVQSRKERQKGIRKAEVNRGTAYIQNVEMGASNKEPFSLAITEACSLYDEDNIMKIGDRWNRFCEALETKIERDIDNNTELNALKEDIAGCFASLERSEITETGIWKDLDAIYDGLQRYRARVEKYVYESSSFVAYSIFNSPVSTNANSKLDYRIETYLLDKDNKFIHPNAIRYFLYKTLDRMKLARAVQECELYGKGEKKDGGLVGYFNNLETNLFDDTNTADVTETYAERKKSFQKEGVYEKFFVKGLGKNQEVLKSRFAECRSKIDEYCKTGVLINVYDAGIKYIENLIKAVESFFDSFESKVTKIEKKISEIGGKYKNSQGIATRYVCASKVCLDSLLEEMPYVNGSIAIAPELSERIYNKIRDYADMTSKPDNERYFEDLFDEGIMGYFRKSVMDTYADVVNKDIISAIEAEAQYEKGIIEWNEKEIYIKDVFNECKVLAAPFIEKPLGEEKEPLHSCAYSKKLNPGDESPRAQLVNSELKNFGGVEAEEFPVNEIIFYKSFYGLRANDLSKFAPPQKGQTYSRTAGDYYKAYYELVSKIHPNAHESKVITPHIDKWWHNVSKMPDLDEENQEIQERKVYAAFFWGLLCGFFDVYETGRDEKIYKLKPGIVESEDMPINLIVSNGTPCDTLYEVLDSLSVYPMLVDNILLKAESLMSEELNKNVVVNEGFLIRDLRKFRLAEYPIQAKKREFRSILDLPVLFKKSITLELYLEEKVQKILKMEISEIRRYLNHFCTDKELPHVMGDLLMEQFNMYIEDLEVESETWKDVYKDYLFDATCTIVANELTELGRNEDANYIKDLSSKLRK